MTTRLYTHPIYLEHVTPPGHPERPDRLRAIARAAVLDAKDDLLICKWHRRINDCVGIRNVVQHSHHGII